MIETIEKITNTKTFSIAWHASCLAILNNLINFEFSVFVGLAVIIANFRNE
jgi:hypothetical protein